MPNSSGSLPDRYEGPHEAPGEHSACGCSDCLSKAVGSPAETFACPALEELAGLMGKRYSARLAAMRKDLERELRWIGGEK